MCDNRFGLTAPTTFSFGWQSGYMQVGPDKQQGRWASGLRKAELMLSELCGLHFLFAGVCQFGRCYFFCIGDDMRCLVFR